MCHHHHHHHCSSTTYFIVYRHVYCALTELKTIFGKKDSLTRGGEALKQIKKLCICGSILWKFFDPGDISAKNVHFRTVVCHELLNDLLHDGFVFCLFLLRVLLAPYCPTPLSGLGLAQAKQGFMNLQKN